MLSERQTATIKATAPALEACGETLARDMYARMFKNNPEVKPYFNPAHQQSGRQQRALASAVCAYAQYVDNPAALADAVELIANKHVSLGILPEHYPVVGKNLLESIKAVMGDAATPEVIDAWAAAYAQLADIFIAREHALYDAKQQRYGWTGLKPFVVARREAVSDNIVSLYLEPEDGAPLAAHRPGQYVAVHTTLPNGATALRNYSLSNAPGTPYYRISVKRELASSDDAPAGVFSHYAHDELAVGDRVRLSPPCGEFTLAPSAQAGRPLVLMAGGVGITPLLSMLHAALAAEPERRVILIQAVRNEALRPFADELAELARLHPNFELHIRYSEEKPQAAPEAAQASRGFIDDALLNAVIGETPADYYFCGPNPMLAHVCRLLDARGVAAEHMHYEFFGPADSLEAA